MPKQYQLMYITLPLNQPTNVAGKLGLRNDIIAC